MQDQLHVVTAISNPLRWKTRYDLAKAAIAGWVQEPNVHVTVVEVAHGARDYALDKFFAAHPQVTHIPVRATTMAWSKENCLNLGISHLPQGAKYIAASVSASAEKEGLKPRHPRPVPPRPVPQVEGLLPRVRGLPSTREAAPLD